MKNDLDGDNFIDVIGWMKEEIMRTDNSYIEQLLQLFEGVTWDGNLISKTHRDELVKRELAVKCNVGGWNLITPKGVEYLSDLGLVHPK